MVAHLGNGNQVLGLGVACCDLDSKSAVPTLTIVTVVECLLFFARETLYYIVFLFTLPTTWFASLLDQQDYPESR